MLEGAGVEFDIIEYLKTPPDRDGFADLAIRLDHPPTNLVRKDPRFYALGLAPDAYEHADDVAKVLVQHPELMQRPLIDDGERVIVARPMARAEDWLANR